MRRIRLFPIALGIFFALATAIVFTAGFTLLWPGSALDSIWMLKPERRTELMEVRLLAGCGFLMLAGPMAAAAIGCFRRRGWGRWLAMAIFAVNGLSDAVQLVLGHWLEGSIGLAVAGVLIWVLWWSKADFRRVSSALAPESGRL